MTEIRTRFAPSPTGDLHLGSARVALFAYLYAYTHNGEYLLRIEDTDRERSTISASKNILTALEWLGIPHAKEPVWQSHRFDRYRDIANQLHHANQAYYCSCSKERLDKIRDEQMQAGGKPKYDGKCRDLNLPPAPNHVLRFRTSQTGSTSFTDLVYGKITVANQDLDDLIIIRTDGSPTYNFCVVIDDNDMGITHVIRGEDHLNNTPRQINILKALAAPIPEYAHLPMILNNSGQKLSKRHGACSVLEFQHLGYLPEAVLNTVFRLGFGHGNQEFFTLQDMQECFNLKGVGKSGSRFDQKKMTKLNRLHLENCDPQRLINLLNTFINSQTEQQQNFAMWPNMQTQLNQLDPQRLIELLNICRPRSKDLGELYHILQLFLCQPSSTFTDHANLTPLNTKMLTIFTQHINNSPEWSAAKLDELIAEIIAQQDVSMKELGMPLRCALFGTSNAPALTPSLLWLGHGETKVRLQNFQNTN